MKEGIEKALRKAARLADKAAQSANEAALVTMKKYGRKDVTDEDDITGVLVGHLDAAFNNTTTGGLIWTSKIMRHRKGVASEEKQTGADLLFHISINTPELTYSKGILIQAKRVDAGMEMTKAAHQELLSQCKTMLSVSPAAFVFNYTKSEVRCASAMRVRGTASRELHSTCNLTSYRFFWEFFRCTTGDPNIISTKFEDLNIPKAIHIAGTTAPKRLKRSATK